MYPAALFAIVANAGFDNYAFRSGGHAKVRIER